MKQIRTLVVAVSFDERDAVTLRHAARIASEAESETVYVVHVAPTFDLPEDVADRFPELVRPVDEALTERLQAMLAKRQSEFPAKTRVECVVREGRPAEVLLRLAARKSADLICVGAHAEDADSIHVAAPTIVRKAPCSVLVVPSGFEPNYERILVPVDFSECSRSAVEQAVKLASIGSGGSLVLLHVYQVPIGYAKTGQSYEEVAEVMRDVAKREWERFSRTVEFDGVPWEIRFELNPNAPSKIATVANEIDARLVVLASHGRTMPAGFLLGHVTDTVCSRIARPVYCVKKKGEVVSLLRALKQLYDFE